MISSLNSFALLGLGDACSFSRLSGAIVFLTRTVVVLCLVPLGMSFRLNSLVACGNARQRPQRRARTFLFVRNLKTRVIDILALTVVRGCRNPIVCCCCVRSGWSCFLTFVAGTRARTFRVKVNLLHINNGRGLAVWRILINLFHQICILSKSSR